MYAVHPMRTHRYKAAIYAPPGGRGETRSIVGVEGGERVRILSIEPSNFIWGGIFGGNREAVARASGSWWGQLSLSL